MLKINFNVIDKIRGKEDYIQYLPKKFIKFKDIYDLMWQLCPEYGRENGETVTLLFLYEGKKRLIREFNRYIRDEDTIEIIISQSSYLLCDVQGYEIEQSENINDLYFTYRFLNITYEVFIVKIENQKLFLVDVLDSGIRRYNECINRLITRYNF